MFIIDLEFDNENKFAIGEELCNVVSERVPKVTNEGSSHKNYIYKSRMNIKTRTLIIAFITIAVVICISDDLGSISAVLGLISFIMICHFYLNRHQQDIADILKDFQI